MNISSLVGIVAALTVLAGSILGSSKSLKVFLDPHGILIVIGGTAAAGLLCFPLRFYVRTAKIFTNKFLGNYAIQYDAVIIEIVGLAQGLRENPDHLKQKVKTVKSHFLRDAVELVCEGGISHDELTEIMIKRAQTHSKRYDHDAGVFKTIAKFPPAFGLMGTTLGMISLMGQLGEKDAIKLLGPSMAIGLVATFYGLVLANLILIPIAENLASLNREDETVRTIIIDGMRLLLQERHPNIIREHLKSYLLPGERAKLTKGKSAPAKAKAKA